MPPNGMRSSRNAATASSFAPLSATGITPPAFCASIAILRQGKRSISGASNVSDAMRAKSSRSPPNGMRRGYPIA